MMKPDTPKFALVPCPFCGKQPRSQREPGWIWIVACQNIKCHAAVRVKAHILGEPEDETKLKAETMWNTRAPISAAPKPSKFDINSLPESVAKYIIDKEVAAFLCISRLQTMLGENGRMDEANKIIQEHNKRCEEIGAAPKPDCVGVEEAVGRAIVKEAWAIEGLPAKALTTGYKLLGRAAIECMASQGLLAVKERAHE